MGTQRSIRLSLAGAIAIALFGVAAVATASPPRSTSTMSPGISRTMRKITIEIPTIVGIIRRKRRPTNPSTPPQNAGRALLAQGPPSSWSGVSPSLTPPRRSSGRC